MAVSGDRAPPGLVPHALRDLVKLEARPLHLTEIAYEWCSAIYECRENFEDWESLLLVCLELGFRYLDPFTHVTLAHTEHHRALVDVVFKSQKSDAIADLLQAWTMQVSFLEYADEMIGMCTGHLIGLHNRVPFSPRLRWLIIRSIDVIGYNGFEDAGVEKLVELLDHLHVAAEDVDRPGRWASLLLDVIRSPGGTQRLSHWYWEVLVKFAVSEYWWLEFGDTDARKIAKSLIDAQEWDKLECWIGIVWMYSESAGIKEEDLEHSMLLLFRQRPGAAQKLEQRLERWSQQHSSMRIPESFQRTLTQAQEAVQRRNTP